MASLARRQKGNVTREQLLQAGFTRDVIDRRRRLGSLHVMFPGVYLVGHQAEPPLARECAALLYCAPKALLSHMTAGWLWRSLVARPVDVQLTVVGRHRRSREGLRVHSIDALEPAELRRVGGLPITSPSLTLLDLGGDLREADLARALNEARVQGLVNDRELNATLRAHPNRRGARALAALLRSEESEFAVESEAERVCLRLMLEHDLKPDASRAWIGRYRVDFLYEPERLVVEVDGYRYHRTKSRFVEDRRRRADLIGMGYEVFPITWSDLADQARATMRRLRAARNARRRLLGLTALRT
jgi:very-short-patch-repair endonuclease